MRFGDRSSNRFLLGSWPAGLSAITTSRISFHVAPNGRCILLFDARPIAASLQKGLTGTFSRTRYSARMMGSKNSGPRAAYTCGDSDAVVSTKLRSFAARRMTNGFDSGDQWTTLCQVSRSGTACRAPTAETTKAKGTMSCVCQVSRSSCLVMRAQAGMPVLLKGNVKRAGETPALRKSSVAVNRMLWGKGSGNSLDDVRGLRRPRLPSCLSNLLQASGEISARRPRAARRDVLPGKRAN